MKMNVSFPVTVKLCIPDHEVNCYMASGAIVNRIRNEGLLKALSSLSAEVEHETLELLLNIDATDRVIL